MDTSELIAAVNAKSNEINKKAGELLTLMSDCGVGEIAAGGVWLRVVKKRASAGVADYLMMFERGNEFRADFWVAVELKPSATNEDSNIYGDVACTVAKPTREQLVKFAGALPQIIAKIEKMAEAE